MMVFAVGRTPKAIEKGGKEREGEAEKGGEEREGETERSRGRRVGEESHLPSKRKDINGNTMFSMTFQ